MSIQSTSDFERGYNYAKRWCKRLAESSSTLELLELAKVLRETTGENAELAKGIAAYLAEVVREERE